MNTLFLHRQKGDEKPEEATLFDQSDLFMVCSKLVQNTCNYHSQVSILGTYTDKKYPAPIVPNMKFKSSFGDMHAYLKVDNIAMHDPYKTRKRVLASETVDVDSFRGLLGLHDDVRRKLQYAKAKASTSESSDPNDIVVRPFRLCRLVKVNSHQEPQPLTEANLIPQLAFSKKVYIEYLQSSYSTTTNTMLDKFEWPFDLKDMDLDKVYTELQKHNTRSANGAARAFVDQRAQDLESRDESVRRDAENWRAGVDRAVTSLNQWSTVLPILKTYNEATRRLIINEVVREVATYTATSMMVEAYQCTNQSKPPEHFQGTGPLDYLIGLTTIEMYPTAAHVRAVSEREDFDGDEDEECTGEEPFGYIEEPRAARLDPTLEVHAGDLLSAVRLPPSCRSTDLEAKRMITLAALRQVCAQIHDKVYVADADIVAIANHEAISTKALEALESGKGPAATVTSGKGPSNKRKRELPEEPVHKNQKLTGIISTGQTWQVYQFEFRDMADPNAKMAVEFTGEFFMPVLKYDSTKVGSGATKVENVDRYLVENVMAALAQASSKEK